MRIFCQVQYNRIDRTAGATASCDYLRRVTRVYNGEVNVSVTKFEVERFSVVSSNSFEEVIAAIEAQVGHPDMREFLSATAAAPTLAELEIVVQRAVGRTDLILFMKLDLGAIVHKEAGLGTVQIVRLLVGNPLGPVIN